MAMQNNEQFGLPIHVIHQLREVFRKYAAIDQVILYGSRAMGKARPGSDIDLCIDSDTLTLTELLAIENEIDDLLFPWKVDLSIRNKIDNPNLLEHINLVGIEFYRRYNFEGSFEEDR